MEDKFIKDGKKISDKTNEQREVELAISILKTKRDLAVANHNFEFAENELIDYYAYQIKANKSKLDYLVKKAKEEGIVLDMLNEIYLRKNEVV
jgi:hypothetical protein